MKKWEKMSIVSCLNLYHSIPFSVLKNIALVYISPIHIHLHSLFLRPIFKQKKKLVLKGRTLNNTINKTLKYEFVFQIVVGKRECKRYVVQK